MNRAQALSKLNRSDMRNAAAERGMQRLFTWNRAHWIGMVVLIAGVAATAVELINVSHAPTRFLTGLPKNLFVWVPPVWFCTGHWCWESPT